MRLGAGRFWWGSYRQCAVSKGQGLTLGKWLTLGLRFRVSDARTCIAGGVLAEYIIGDRGLLPRVYKFEHRTPVLVLLRMYCTGCKLLHLGAGGRSGVYE